MNLLVRLLQSGRAVAHPLFQLGVDLDVLLAASAIWPNSTMVNAMKLCGIGAPQVSLS